MGKEEIKRCYTCHNIRKIPVKDLYGKDQIGIFREIVDDTLKLKEQDFNWTQFDGTKVSIKIFKCEDCLKRRKELEEYKPPSGKDIGKQVGIDELDEKELKT
jgi:hypothetical protein